MDNIIEQIEKLVEKRDADFHEKELTVEEARSILNGADTEWLDDELDKAQGDASQGREQFILIRIRA